MMRRVALLLALAGTLGAQEVVQVADAEATRRPQFLLALSSGNARGAEKTVPIDVARTPLLHQRVALDLRRVPLKQAIDMIAAQARLTLWYSDDVLPKGVVVQLSADNITVAAALTDVLLDTGLDVVFSRDGTASLVKRPAAVRPPAVGTVTGVVTEAATGNAVPRAQVSVSGVGRGATTGEDGRYTIAGVPAGTRTVSARRLGYDPQSREVSVSDGGSVTADFQLAGGATSLTEILTTATGQRRRAEVGNAIGVISADTLVTEAPVSRLSDVLGSRVAGVQIVAGTGLTGESPRVRIRGLSSISLGREPLLYVDGIRVNNSSGASVTGYGISPGRFNDINPEEIASIEVVRGPSAATLYGTDAANGIILITTKRGRPGAAQWRVNSELGSLKPSVRRFPASFFPWGRNAATGAIQRCSLQQQAVGSCIADSVTSFNPLNDPQTTVIGTGGRSQVGTQVTGGVGLVGYFIGAEYEAETGYLQMSDAERSRISTERGGQ